MKAKLHLFIFLAMILGIITGLLLNGMDEPEIKGKILSTFDLFGKTIFIGALKMIVAPLIFFSILNAISSLSFSGELKSLGTKTLVYFFASTSVAVIIGLFFVLTIKPGYNGSREDIRLTWQERKAEIQQKYSITEEKIEIAGKQTGFEALKKNIQNIIMNPFQALAESQTLGIIFFAILLGIALIVIGPPGKPVLPVISGINEAIMKLTGWVMAGSPFFIFCLISSLVGGLGWSVFEPLTWYVATVIIGICVHVCVLFCAVKFIGKMSPREFLKGIRKPWMVAFSTRSSAATLPVTTDSVINELGVPEKIANFVLPLGTTVNMNGTALYEGVAVIFLIQLFGGMPGVEITLTPLITFIVFVTAVLAAVGAAAIPDAGLITMVLVANAVGLPVEYISIIFAVDAFLDMFRTSTNVMDDCVGCVIINRLESGACK